MPANAPDLALEHGSAPLSAPVPPTLLRDRILVTLGALLWVVGTVVGTGPVGMHGEQRQGEGLFSDSATLIAPHGPAFAIWIAIYLAVAAYVVWQWLPAASASCWARRTRVPAATAFALTGLWLLTVFLGWIGLSALVIAAIAIALGVVWEHAAREPREGLAAGLVVGVTFGVYLGWVCVAVCANVALFIVNLGVLPPDAVAASITIAVLAVVVALAAFLSLRQPHPAFVAGLHAAIAWGLAWMAVARFVGQARSEVVAWAAIVAAIAVVAIGAARLVALAATTRRGIAVIRR